MGSIDVARLHSLIRLPRSDDAARGWMSRIDAIQNDLVETHLEPALAPFTMTDEVVCVRRIVLPLRISSAVTDWQSSQQWSALIAAELQRILARNAPDEVVRFPHALAAQQAFVMDALTGRSERDWAWRQLGWLPATDPVSGADRVDAAIARLAGDARIVVPALRRLAAAGLLPALAHSLDGPRRDRLLIAALAAIPDAAVALALWVVDGTPERADLPDEPGRPRPPSASGALAAAFRAVLTSAATDPEDRRAWAVLAALCCAPHALRTSPAQATAATAAWLQAMAPSSRPARASTRETPAPEQARPPIRHDPQDFDRDGAPDRPVPAPPDPLRAGRSAPASPPAHGADVLADEPSTLRGPVEGETAYGGLLFLLPLVAGTGALDGLLAAPALVDWPLPAMLHRLALTLLPPLRPVDPAALAFAGLMPDAVPPDATAPGDWRRTPDAAAAAALDAAARRIIDELANRLPLWAGPALGQRVAERRAVIAADPGWIDVRLRLSDISVDLRRAALDLDPGFLPWLGIVLRFSYA